MCINNYIYKEISTYLIENMDSPKSCIAVLWDDDLQSENALKHALKLADKSSSDIVFLKVIKKKSFFESADKFNALVEAETGSIRKKVEELNKKYSTSITLSILQGNLQTCVNEFIEKNNCSLIVSPEFVTLNKGVKANTIKEFSKYGAIEVPIMIATNEPQSEFASIEVVVPMEFTSEFKDTIEWVISFYRKYGCNFDFVKPALSPSIPKQDLINNIYFTKQVLDANNVIYGIKTASKEHIFVDDIYEFAENIQANYILSTTLNYAEFRKSAKFQSIPYICINPKKRKYANFN